MDEEKEYPVVLQENEKALFHILEAQWGKEKALNFILSLRGEHKKETKQRVLKIKKESDEAMEICETDLSLDTQDGAEDSLRSLVELKTEDAVIKEVLKNIEEMLKELTSKEQIVLRLRFGLNDGHCKKLREIGEILGLTRERVRQIEARALEKLQKRLR